ncbi:MAG: (2Fe-2S)-binding protein [Deltaproteobacteria bacterium]|nr:(2Fe-2S)-binding protein [Deltaproteobacteria bacterium]
MKHLIMLKVNGASYEIAVAPQRTLLEVLREELNLMGTKEGCDMGACGACTVLVDGNPVLSCMTLAMDTGGKDILTIEGLTSDSELDPLQQAFIDQGAIQCGYCTPGMILSAKALLNQNPNPSIDEVKEAISGNLCRCTGYKMIVNAVVSAGERISSDGNGKKCH